MSAAETTEPASMTSPSPVSLTPVALPAGDTRTVATLVFSRSSPPARSKASASAPEMACMPPSGYQ